MTLQPATPRTLPPPVREVYPWASHWLDVNGGNMHYIDEGPRDAPVMLCIHGNPTWSFYWRELIQKYAGAFRVIVPDHIGCGLSEKPQDWSYRLADHVTNLQTLVEALDLKDITLVVHDWGGAIGMGVATRQTDRFSRFVVTNTAAFLSKSIPPSIAVVKVPGFGALAVRGGNAFARIATWRAVSRPLEPSARDGLLFPYGSWADRIATLRFVQDIPLSASHPSYAELSRIDRGLEQLQTRPMLICWGDADFCFTPQFRAEWERRFPTAEVHHWSDVGHYVMEDAHDRVVNAMDAFLTLDEAQAHG
ncbi:MAG: alpha/beta fold hydrolase [Myxococcota bacterium]|nr:alpha/beta fold hydrolase [Myxococcota bacterium]